VKDLQSPDELWIAFAAARPDLVGDASAFSSWHFCDNQQDADELVALVLAGVKRATAGCLLSYELDGDPIPQVGEFSVVTDWTGHARCVIRATSVEVVAFSDVSEEFAAAEGEGDGSLEYWQEAHRAAFGRELALTGRALGADTRVVCEQFEVVFAGSA